MKRLEGGKMPQIIKEKCIGCSICANICPKGIEMVNGIAKIKDENADCLINAANSCPRGAILLDKKESENKDTNINFNQDYNQNSERGQGAGQGRGMGAGQGRGLGMGPRDGRRQGRGGGGRGQGGGRGRW